MNAHFANFLTAGFIFCIASKTKAHTSSFLMDNITKHKIRDCDINFTDNQINLSDFEQIKVVNSQAR